MTKTLKWLGGGIAAAMLLGLAGLFSGELAEAQPDGAPHRFAGTVTLDGEGAAAGTSVTAIINDAECGSATVLTNASGSRYVLDVPASCAEAGDTVHFKVGGYDAAETGTWNGTFSAVNLTAERMMEDPPAPGMGDGMDECPEEGMTGETPEEPMEPSEGNGGPAEPELGEADECPEEEGDELPEEPPEPGEATAPAAGMDDDLKAGNTGTGLAAGGSWSLASILAVLALASVLGATTVARRRR